MRKSKKHLILNALLHDDGFYMVSKTLLERFDDLTLAFIFTAYLDTYKYHIEKKKDFDGWFYFKYEDQMEKLKCKRETLVKASKKFEDYGLLKTKRQGMPSKVFYYINFSTVLSFLEWDEEKQETPINSKVHQPRRKPTACLEGNRRL